jgi:hypothetical protein
MTIKPASKIDAADLVGAGVSQGTATAFLAAIRRVDGNVELELLADGAVSVEAHFPNGYVARIELNRGTHTGITATAADNGKGPRVLWRILPDGDIRSPEEAATEVEIPEGNVVAEIVPSDQLTRILTERFSKLAAR